MKSSIRILLLISSILFLTGCGSEDEELPISGMWEITNNGITSYFSFTSQQASSYTYTEEYECHNGQAFPVTSLTSSTINFSDGKTNNYTVMNNVLTIDETLILTRTTDIPDFVSCADPTATGTLSIEVEFDHLPETFSIRNGTDEYLGSFRLDIEFDLSSSDSNDTKLFNIIADYSFKGTQDSNIVSMDNLSSGTYFNSGGNRSISLTHAPYTINDNTITFSFTRSEHKIFKEITNTNSMKITALFTDPDSGLQQDNFPDSGYTEGIVLNDAMDAVGDIYSDSQYLTIVDIKSVTVTVTE